MFSLSFHSSLAVVQGGMGFLGLVECWVVVVCVCEGLLAVIGHGIKTHPSTACLNMLRSHILTADTHFHSCRRLIPGLRGLLASGSGGGGIIA